jgi:hypothetical protein
MQGIKRIPRQTIQLYRSQGKRVHTAMTKQKGLIGMGAFTVLIFSVLRVNTCVGMACVLGRIGLDMLRFSAVVKQEFLYRLRIHSE